MASWVTHLWIADEVLKNIPELDRVGFCVGSIAPDCNVENADWTAFTPPREMTHFMSGKRKCLADSERFFEEYLAGKSYADRQEEAFYWGYYAHLVADALQQTMLRDEERVKAMFRRMEEIPDLKEKLGQMKHTFDNMKKLLPREDRMQDYENMEAEYLDAHPESGYNQVILPLKSYPDYPDFLPKGAIVRKIGVMGTLPEHNSTKYPYIAVSKQEYIDYIACAAKYIINAWRTRR